ncbi:MAG: GNAT family N-acetyltransferase [Planctomycetota bacterium]
MTDTVSSVRADRLELIPSSPALARAAHEDRVALGELLNCAISNRWPPELIAGELEPAADLVCDQPDLGHWSIWYAIDRAEHLLVGNVRFPSPPDERGVVEIRYAMADDERGKGYATEAVGAMSDWALGPGGAAAIRARVPVDNASAIRVLEKAGFTRARAHDGGDELIYERVN